MKTRKFAPSKMLAIWLSAASFIFSSNTIAQPNANAAVPKIDSNYTKKRSVRVVVRGIDVKGRPWAKVSSGFLWQRKDWIVTSLHGVPDGRNISVSCNYAAPQKAEVVKLHRNADLILLKAAREFSDCEAFNSYPEKAPEETTSLWAFGWNNGARGGTSRHMFKGFGDPEKLSYIVGSEALDKLSIYNIPSTELDIYIVQGSLLPGYSGGPVINANYELVGVVDGGLNKGADDYNWLIPARELDNLLASNVKEIPEDVAKLSGLLFSSDVNLDHPPIEIFSSGTLESIPEVQYSEDGWNYRWDYAKTQSLFQLSQTSDDQEGVLGLLRYFDKVGANPSPEALEFDIFEDQNNDLIIAVPAGQGLQYGEVDQDRNKGFYLLDSNSPSGWQSIQYKQTTWSIMSSVNPAVHVKPGDPGYFQELVAELLAGCHQPEYSHCQLLKPTLRMIDFGQGKKILKVGLLSRRFDNGMVSKIDYYSYAVKDGVAFQSRAQLSPENQSSLLNCAWNLLPNCTDNETTRRELSQLLAVHLSTFSNLDLQASQRATETQFRYDSSADNPSTLRKPFYEGQVARFYNSRGKVWKHHVSESSSNLFTEVYRDNEFVQIKGHGTTFRLPIQGGLYYELGNDQQWQPRGEISTAK